MLMQGLIYTVDCTKIQDVFSVSLDSTINSWGKVLLHEPSLRNTNLKHIYCVKHVKHEVIYHNGPRFVLYKAALYFKQKS